MAKPFHLFGKTIKKEWYLSGVALAIVFSYFLFVLDVGLNSTYFVERDFNRAFRARMAGNCTLFSEYIAAHQTEWTTRCEGKMDAIENFSITGISVDKNKAFVGAVLKRGVDTRARYEMVRDITGSSFLGLPATRWYINHDPS